MFQIKFSEKIKLDSEHRVTLFGDNIESEFKPFKMQKNE